MTKKFEWGDKVIITKHALERHLFKKPIKGICLGMKTTMSIVVVCEGQVTPMEYSISFWEKDKP